MLGRATKQSSLSMVWFYELSRVLHQLVHVRSMYVGLLVAEEKAGRTVVRIACRVSF